MEIFFKFVKKPDNKKLHKEGRNIIKLVAKDYYNIENPEVRIKERKPYFKYSDLKFSISHSRDIVAVCFDENEVGFDIEKIKECDYLEIAKWMRFRLVEKTIEEFFDKWTQFEAKYKLQDITNYIYTQSFLDKYSISVASKETTEIKEKLKIYEIKEDKIISFQ
jgi:hypothetical protein